MSIAVVRGTSTGIGFATAVTLGRAGHTVATMRNLKSGAELQRIASEEKLPIALATLDVDNDVSVSDAFDKVLTEYGRIDVLVNNAGIGGEGQWKKRRRRCFARLWRRISSADSVVLRL